MRIAKSEFKNYFSLAGAIGHELNHVADYFNGNNSIWLVKGTEYRRAMSELKAYLWEANNGGNVYMGEIQHYLLEEFLWRKFADFNK